ncbi:hypothetical protein ACIQ57_05610 [Lysinibacillus xylanilyticus]|uniref:hypothetical protein n=1 Tax=Lysinibacillus xylanilyticus TaxID=582475 RepID=UPI00380FF35E
MKGILDLERLTNLTIEQYDSEGMFQKPQMAFKTSPFLYLSSFSRRRDKQLVISSPSILY